MMKSLVVTIALIFSFAFVVTPVFAATPSPTPASTTQESTQSSEAEVVAATTEKIDSFTLFWPMVAGKTKEDSFYFLKRLKEDLRGMLIFGKPQKAEYEVFIGAKRLLEAEKLLNDGKTDVAKETLTEAENKFKSGKELLDQAKGDPNASEAVAGIKNRMTNVDKLVSYLLSSKENAPRETLESIKKMASDVQAY